MNLSLPQGRRRNCRRLRRPAIPRVERPVVPVGAGVVGRSSTVPSVIRTIVLPPAVVTSSLASRPAGPSELLVLDLDSDRVVRPA